MHAQIPAMKHIYIFNPEHDLALASGLSRFTAPRAGRVLRNDLCFLPALLVTNDDLVIVNDLNYARESITAQQLSCEATLLTMNQLAQYVSADNENVAICPWGWDAAIKGELERAGVSPTLLPSAEKLQAIRRMSHRRWAADNLLRTLRSLPGTIGEAWAMKEVEDVVRFQSKNGGMVLKAPWSSSGRGVHYINFPLTPSLKGWTAKVIRQQQAVMVEPLYNKVLDFGMEFKIDKQEKAKFCGLSVFETNDGTYKGNIIDTEEVKCNIICEYIPNSLLISVKEKLQELFNALLSPFYCGPLGIDMMIVLKDGQYLLHPCVEMNLRMTMGHVALALFDKRHIRGKTMNIAFDGHYHFFLR